MALAALALSLSLLQVTPTIPDLFLGQWTDDFANFGGEDTQGVRIEPDRIEFYEAVGIVQSVTVKNEGAITASLSFKGEGRSWAEVAHLKLSNDLSGVEMRVLGDKLVLMRCPVVLDL